MADLIFFLIGIAGMLCVVLLVLRLARHEPPPDDQESAAPMTKHWEE